MTNQLITLTDPRSAVAEAYRSLYINLSFADQKQSKAAKGNRFVDDVKDFAVTGDRATATVGYHVEKSADNKSNTPMTFVRENGGWKVCSPGAR